MTSTENELSAELWQLAFNDSRDASLLTDIEGRVLAVSAEARRLLDIEPGALVGRLLTSLVSSEVAPTFRHAFRAILEGTGWSGEVTLLGAKVPCRLEGKVLARDGRPMAIQLFLEDLGQGRRRGALEAVARGVSGQIGTNFFSSVVHHLSRVLGADFAFIGELVGAGDVRTVAVSARGEVAPNFTYSLAGTPCAEVMERQACVYESGIQRLFPADTLLVDMAVESYLGTTMMDSRGCAQGLLVVLHTAPLRYGTDGLSLLRIFAARASAELERLRMERALVEDRRRLEQILETAPDGIMLLEANARVHYANPAAGALLGRPSQELVGRLLTQLQLEPDAPEGACPTDEPLSLSVLAQSGAKVNGALLHLRRPDGSRAVVSVNAAPIDGGDEVVVAFQDVTERLRIERMKDEFLDVSSHELRTPLTALRLLIEKGQRSMAGGNAMGSGDLDRMGRICHRLQRLVHDVLDVSRIERGQLAMSASDEDLDFLVADNIDTLRLECGGSLELSRSLVPLTVRADPMRVEQVLTNLVDNAVKYSPDGRTVEVKVSRSGTDALVEVLDRGPGIPLEAQRHLFGRFFRIEAGRRGIAGLGLGLYISRRIVEQHGGRMGYREREDGGSVFFFSVPLVEQGASQAVWR